MPSSSVSSSGGPPRLGRDPWLWLAAGGGAGLAPFAPGTFGSLVGLALAFAFSLAPFPTAWVACLVAAAVGPAICARGAAATGGADPGWVVWDEIVGVWLAVLLGPAAWAPYGLDWLAPFVLFRFYDILKPGPVRALERLPGGHGVMADDLAAGAVAAATAWLIAWGARGLG